MVASSSIDTAKLGSKVLFRPFLRTWLLITDTGAHLAVSLRSDNPAYLIYYIYARVCCLCLPSEHPTGQAMAPPTWRTPQALACACARYGGQLRWNSGECTYYLNPTHVC